MNETVDELKQNINLLNSDKEALQEELARLKQELDELQLLHINTVEYATTLENGLEEQLENLTHNKTSLDPPCNDIENQLRHQVAITVAKEEHLQSENRHLIEQLKEFRLLYVNTVEHSTAIENELDEKYREVSRLSVTDPLTGILNRAGFIHSFEAEQEKSGRSNQPISLIMYDIDFFKKVNDIYGHAKGDEVLITMTAISQKAIRKSDYLVRWGGEEFIIILPGLNLTQAVHMAERIRSKIAAYNFPELDGVTSSFGVSQYSDDEPLDRLLKRVDDALYQAKQSGRNCVKSL